MDQRRPSYRSSAAAEGADPILDYRGVSVNHHHIFEIDPKPVGCNLGKRCLLSLSVRRGASQHRYRSSRLYTDGSALPATRRRSRRGTDRADLNVSRQADTEQPSLGSFSLLLIAELLVARHIESLVERRPIVAAVVDKPRCSRKWKLVWSRK